MSVESELFQVEISVPSIKDLVRYYVFSSVTEESTEKVPGKLRGNGDRSISNTYMSTCPVSLITKPTPTVSGLYEKTVPTPVVYSLEPPLPK